MIKLHQYNKRLNFDDDDDTDGSEEKPPVSGG